MKPVIRKFTCPCYGLSSSKVSAYKTLYRLLEEQLIGIVRRELQIEWLINIVERNVHLHLYEYGK